MGFFESILNTTNDVLNPFSENSVAKKFWQGVSPNSGSNSDTSWMNGFRQMSGGSFSTGAGYSGELGSSIAQGEVDYGTYARAAMLPGGSANTTLNTYAAPGSAEFREQEYGRLIMERNAQSIRDYDAAGNKDDFTKIYGTQVKYGQKGQQYNEAEQYARIDQYADALNDKSFDDVSRKEITDMYKSGASSVELSERLSAVREGKGVYGIRNITYKESMRTKTPRAGVL